MLSYGCRGEEERRKERRKERKGENQDRVGQDRAEQNRMLAPLLTPSHGYSPLLTAPHGSSRLLTAPLLATPHVTLTASLCVLSRNFNRSWM